MKIRGCRHSAKARSAVAAFVAAATVASVAVAGLGTIAACGGRQLQLAPTGVGAATGGPRSSSRSTPTGVVATVPSGATSVSSGAFVRVNQVGYAATAPKRAYLMTHAAAAGAVFTVSRDGVVVAGPLPIGASQGAWNRRFRHVYALDFDRLTEAGTYTVAVSGPVRAVSPPFAIGSGAAVYAPALANALRFYQTERDGPSFYRSALRTAPAHLNDRHALTYRTPRVNGDGVFRGDLSSLHVRIDASGGWWDAGDYLKFVHATAYVEALMLAGERDFPAQMGAASRTADFSAEGVFGATWLLHMWNDRTRTLYYQVGIGSGNAHTAGDHDIWRLPQRDDTWRAGDPVYRYIRHRPVFRAGKPGSKISPNLAGRDAAALALAYQVYRTGRPVFASRCLRAAVHIFALADPAPKRLMTAIPYDYYPEAEWRDDMELGATELYVAMADGGTEVAGLTAVEPLRYLRAAGHWAVAYMGGPHDAADTLNLYDVSGLAHYELYRAIERAGDPAGLEVSPDQLLGDLRKALHRAVAQARRDPFQFGFPWNQWDTTSHGAGLVVMASEYDELTHSTAYAAWASRWLADILGANAWGTSLIVGDGSTFPHCLQHQVANLRGTLNGRSPLLLGAAVEGPNADQDNGTVPGMRLGPSADPFRQFDADGAGGARWRDAVQNYPNTEPAIDLTAASFLAFSRMMAGLD
jgi:endoglucanase